MIVPTEYGRVESLVTGGGQEHVVGRGTAELKYTEKNQSVKGKRYLAGALWMKHNVVHFVCFYNIFT